MRMALMALPILARVTTASFGGAGHISACGATVPDFASCIAETQNNAQALDEALQQAETAGVGAAEERATRAMGNLFLGAAQYDYTHNLTIMYSEALGWQCQGRCPAGLAAAAASRLPYRELEMTSALLANRTSQLHSLIRGSIARQRARDVDWNAVLPCSDNAGWWCEAGTPTFFGSWTWAPVGLADGAATARSLGTSLTDVYLNIAAAAGRSLEAGPDRQYLASVKATLDEMHASNTRVEIFVGTNMPEWAEDTFPGLTNSSAFRQHDFNFDIDHPGARQLLGPVYAAAAKVLGHHPSVVSWMLSNEPAFISSSSNWTQAKYRVWLHNEYGDVGELNRLWNTTFADFWSIPQRDYRVANEGCTAAEWYDWCAFNAARVTDWFTFMHDTIVGASPGARCHAKIMNGGLFDVSSVPSEWQTHAIGIDREALIDLFEINGTHCALCWMLHYCDVNSIDWLSNSTQTEFAIA